MIAASQKSKFATAEGMGMESLPAVDVVPVACNPVALVSTPSAVTTSLQSNGATTTIDHVNLESLPALDVVSVALDIVAFVGAVLAIFATLHTEGEPPVQVMNAVAGRLTTTTPATARTTTARTTTTTIAAATAATAATLALADTQL